MEVSCQDWDFVGRFLLIEILFIPLWESRIFFLTGFGCLCGYASVLAEVSLHNGVESMIAFILSVLFGIFLVVISILLIIARRIFGFSPFRHRANGQASARNQDNPDYGRQPREPNRREGEVSIDYVPPREDFRNARPAPGGPNDDYVEFEEVREERDDN